MLLLGCILSVLLHVAAGFTTSLSGKWSVISANYQSTQNVHGGWDMYSAFYDEKSFGDPLEGYRDIESRWLAKRNWTFIHKFSWHRDQRDFHSLELYIDGIDGFGCLFINDRKLSCLDNSFLNEFWRIDGLVKDGAENILRIEFKSSIETAMQIANSIRRHGDNIPPPDCWPKSYRGECHVNLIRTTQASFGWDWGPAFPIQGFWNIPKLVYSRYGIRLGEGFKFFSTYRQRFDGESLWYADVLIEVRQIDNVGLLDACLLLDLLEKPNVHLRRCFHMGSQPSKLDVHAVLLEGETDITPWWPNNIETGPHVYTLRVRLVGPSDELFDEAKHDVGFRTVELIQLKCELY
ncbi:unnamed protein product [Protopolystoma xenopodis]|uniref:Beta-mannosidase-like galactose-binding domain-containing protein n=1 Tax=Protopolystoma xenopodis TaxID=117903 RepID=A0A448WWC8_9PLAT|nr:unnamed protein product [Protopolystoma xenopodis]